MLGTERQEFMHDALLEFHTDQENVASTCAVLTPTIKSRLRELQSGQVLEVRVNEPSARGDIEAWCRLSGNQLLRIVDDHGPVLSFFIRKK